MTLALAAAEARAQEIWPRNFAPSITTTGTASAEVVPNIATISLGVETERPTAAEAANENARAAQAIIAEIKAQGIDPRDVKTVSVTLSPVYDDTREANGRVTKQTLRGYAARNDLSVRVRQIEKAGALARLWIEKGANSFTGIEYDYDQKEPKYDALRGEAVRDALRKANSYVNGLGVKLGRVLEIAAPSYQGGGAAQAAPLARAVPHEAAIAIPIEPGVETLRTEVQVTWELAQ
jgi:uncharacterized protein YggE